MTQTRLGSLIEACINVAIGFGINFAANLAILPMFGWHATVAQNLATHGACQQWTRRSAHR